MVSNSSSTETPSVFGCIPFHVLMPAQAGVHMKTKPPNLTTSAFHTLGSLLCHSGATLLGDHEVVQPWHLSGTCYSLSCGVTQRQCLGQITRCSASAVQILSFPTSQNPRVLSCSRHFALVCTNELLWSCLEQERGMPCPSQ